MDTRTNPAPELQKQNVQIAGVRSGAARGRQAFAAAANNTNQSNAGTIGPVQVAAFSTTAFTAKVSGKVLVMATIAGLESAVDLTATATLLRDGAPVAGAPTQVVSAGHVTADAWAALAWIVGPAVLGVGHTYGIQLDAGAGNTMTVAPAQANVIVEELPA